MSSVDPAVAPPRTGHPVGFWFFFWGEFAERCSYYGMRAILALYMIERLGVDKGDAGTFMSLFIAACYFFPLVGGWLADNYLGKYWTIVGFSIPYVIAQFLVGIENRYVVFGALTLLAMGSGVIKPNISTLMGLTYDQQRPGQDQLRTSAFSWFYMAINIGAALSQFAMPWLRKKYDYQTAFLFPAFLMVIALTIFALGKRFYAVEKIERKVLSEQEAAANKALKRKTLASIGLVFLLVMFFWAVFDQAASTWIFFADTYMDTTLVGETFDGKHLILSGESLNGIIGTTSFGMSADAIQGFNPVFIILLVPVSVWLFKRLERGGTKIRATQKMTLGFLLTMVAMLIMAYAGNISGTKEKAIKVVTPESVIILPTVEGKDLSELGEMAKSPDKAPAFGKVQLTSNDYEYNKDNKKGLFQNGTFDLGSGQKIVIEKGQINFEKSTNIVTNNKIVLSEAVRESLFKEGTYALGAVSLKVGVWNRAETVAAAAPQAEEPKEPLKASLEVIDWVKPSDRITVWWQVLAYLILTIAEILISVTGLELAFVAAPPSMKSFVTACWLSVVFLANLLINAPITQLYPLMNPGIYFAMLAVLMLVVTFVFLPVAKKFNRTQASQAAAVAEGNSQTV